MNTFLSKINLSTLVGRYQTELRMRFKMKYSEPSFFTNHDYISNIIPWCYISEFSEGVVIQKSGLLQKSFIFRGPDLESSAPVYLANIAYYLNDIIKSLGTGWAYQTEQQKYESKSYPGTDVDNIATYLVEKECEEKFQSFGTHFENGPTVIHQKK